MAEKKLEIDKIIPYKNDVSLISDYEILSEGGRRKLGIHHSMLEVICKDPSMSFTESAESFIRKALHNAIFKDDDYFLLKTIEFGLVELLSVVELRMQYLSYLKGAHKKGGRPKNQTTVELRKRIYKLVERYSKQGLIKSGEQGENTVFAMVSKEVHKSIGRVSELYYEEVRELELQKKLKGIKLTGTSCEFQTQEGYGAKVKSIIDKAINKRPPCSYDEAIRRASQIMLLSEEECRQIYRRECK